MGKDEQGNLVMVEDQHCFFVKMSGLFAEHMFNGRVS